MHIYVSSIRVLCLLKDFDISLVDKEIFSLIPFVAYFLNYIVMSTMVITIKIGDSFGVFIYDYIEVTVYWER